MTDQEGFFPPPGELTRKPRSNWVKDAAAAKRSRREDGSPFHSPPPPICKMFRVQEKGGGRNMGHTRCSLQPPSLATNSRFCAKHEVPRIARGTKIERLFVENRKKEKKYRYHFAICLSSGWKKEALFSIPFLVFLLYPLEKFIVVSASLFLLLLRGKLPIKRTTEKKIISLLTDFFCLFRKGNRSFPPPTGKPQQEDSSLSLLLP